jgi:hypothetical protein
MKQSWDEARRHLRNIMKRTQRAPIHTRYYGNHEKEEMIPRSHVIGMSLFREVEAILDWSIANPKRKTVPREVLESFLDRIVCIIPRELKAIQFTEERMMGLKAGKKGSLA